MPSAGGSWGSWGQGGGGPGSARAGGAVLGLPDARAWFEPQKLYIDRGSTKPARPGDPGRRRRPAGWPPGASGRLGHLPGGWRCWRLAGPEVSAIGRSGHQQRARPVRVPVAAPRRPRTARRRGSAWGASRPTRATRTTDRAGCLDRTAARSSGAGSPRLAPPAGPPADGPGRAGPGVRAGRRRAAGACSATTWWPPRSGRGRWAGSRPARATSTSSPSAPPPRRRSAPGPSSPAWASWP